MRIHLFHCTEVALLLSRTGTLSLSEACNGRLAEILKQNPDILQGLKADLMAELDRELDARGVKMVGFLYMHVKDGL
jgi:hypothetical protein